MQNSLTLEKAVLSKQGATGYAHLQYAHALGEFGSPLFLPHCQGWLLQRPIGTSPELDLLGPYPLFCCANWQALPTDLAELPEALISVVLVSDPFADLDLPILQSAFNHGFVPFKQHYVVDLEQEPKSFVCPHHQRNARQALKQLEIERVDDPLDYLADWIRLYDHLIQRHQIQGIARFSASSFEQQFQIPGFVLYRASLHGETVGLLLWFMQQNVAYYHLAAYSETGYDCKASFALFWKSLEKLRDQVHWLGLGAGAGLADQRDGLTRFKQGWSTGTRTTYLGRHVLNLRRYQELVEQTGIPETKFFPAYRATEKKP